MKRVALVCGIAVSLMGFASAQENPGFAFNVGAGFTTPLGNTGRNLDDGWNVRAGAGYNFSPYFGALIDLSYNNMGINSATLDNLGYGGGKLTVFSATFDPIVHLNPHGHVDVYVTGGGGIYHQYQDFTNPAVIVGNGYNPFFGFYPYALAGNVVVASYTVNKPGIDAGIGIEMGSKWHGKFFAEARYNRIFTGAYHTDYLPVTFGFRW
jgi:Outer membrane protein beta-barrel domain